MISVAASFLLVRVFTKWKGRMPETGNVLQRALVGVYMYAYTPLTNNSMTMYFCRTFFTAQPCTTSEGMQNGEECVKEEGFAEGFKAIQLLVADMEVQCHVGSHAYMLPIALVSLFIYGLAIPVYFARKSLQQRASLDLSLAVCAVSDEDALWQEWDKCDVNGDGTLEVDEVLRLCENQIIRSERGSPFTRCIWTYRDHF